jgi:hypothetical protein
MYEDSNRSVAGCVAARGIVRVERLGMAQGDRLEVERSLLGSAFTYLHHGIDVGDGTVVHARPDDFRRPFGGGRVVRTTWEEFAAGRAVRVVTEQLAAFAGHEVAARALAHVGRPGYCPVVDNCEHFATWCATGVRASRQVQAVADRVGVVAGAVLAAVTARSPGRAVLRFAGGWVAAAVIRGRSPTAPRGSTTSAAH